MLIKRVYSFDRQWIRHLYYNSKNSFHTKIKFTTIHIPNLNNK